MELEYLGDVSTIHMIGDSHCIRFADISFRAAGTDRAFSCRTQYIPNLYLGNEGLLWDGLKGAGFINQAGEAAWLTVHPSDAYVSGRPVLSPAIVMFLGEVDLQFLFSQLGGYDFELPDDPGYGVDFDSAPIDYATVWSQLQARLQPFVEILRTLRQSFPRVMLHGLPPRTRDDEKATRWSFGSPCAAPVRAKLTLAANRFLAAACAAIDVPFIDVYDAMHEDGYLRPGFDLDGLHLSRAAADPSLKAITARLFDHTGSIAHPVRYTAARDLAPAYEGPQHPDLSGWRESGYVVAELAGQSVLGIEERLAFLADPPNVRACPEWVGFPRAGRAGVAMAEPASEVLEWAARLLCVGPGRAALQAGEAKELTVASFRPLQLAPGRSTCAAVLPSPVGCRRAILFIGGAGSFTLEPVSGAAAVSLPARSGSLVVCDPARAWCHVTATDSPASFVEIALAPRYPTHPFRVVAAGLAEWPADPFHYPVAGMLAFPPFDGDQVHERA